MREKPTLLMLHGGPGFCSLDLPAGLLGLGRYRSDRLSRPSRQWPQRGRAARKLESGAVGRRRARVLRRPGHRQSDRAGRVVRRHGRAGLCHTPSGASVKAGADQHRSRRELVSGAGAWRCLNASAVRKSARWRAAGSWRSKAIWIRPRSTPGDGWPSRSIRASPRDPDMARRAVNRSEVLQWFTRPGGESHTFDMLGDLTASDVRPWYSVARTIRFTQSRARRISRRRCRSIWCSSNGLRIAGTPWSPMPRARHRGDPRLHRAPVERLRQNKAGARRRQRQTLDPMRRPYELAFSTVTARRFCDQHEMSLQTATGRSLP